MTYPGQSLGILCICHRCGPPWRTVADAPGDDASWADVLSWSSWMALCPHCGDKRCPGAMDHDRHPSTDGA